MRTRYYDDRGMPGTILLRAGYLLMCWALLIGYACLALIRRLLLVIVFIVPSLCFAETAIEIIPGVTHYGGHSTSVEIIPGHKQYYGEIKGSVTEITPGIQHYHLDRSTPTQGENHVVPYPPAASRVLSDHPYGVAREPK